MLARSKSRVWSAALSAFVLVTVAAYIGWTEHARLAPNIARGWKWAQLGPFFDLFGMVGAGACVLFAFLLPGFAVAIPAPLRPGEVPPPKRGKSTIHGAAKFLTMQEGAERFPATSSAVTPAVDQPVAAGGKKGKGGVSAPAPAPTGSIVIGERYR